MKLNSALILDIIYPIGSYYWNSNLIDIDNVIGGHWERVKDRFVLAVGDTYTTSGATGGSASHDHERGTLRANIGRIPTSNDIYVALEADSENPYAANARFTISSNNWENASTGAKTSISGKTATASNIPPYITAYCWKRIS